MPDGHDLGSALFTSAIAEHLELRAANAWLEDTMPLRDYMPAYAVEARARVAVAAPPADRDARPDEGSTARVDRPAALRGEAELPELRDPEPFTVPDPPSFVAGAEAARRRVAGHAAAGELADELPDFLRDLPEMETAWLEREGAPEFDWGD